MLDGVSEGVVSSRETRLERGRSAALDRVGFAYRVELGAGGLNALDRSLNPGFLGRMNVGWFPAQRFGVLAGTAFGIGPKGSVSTGTEVRPLIAIEVFPVAAGTHHAGLYAEGGVLFGSERLPSLEKQSIGTWTYGGGLLYEHELNALTALSVRGGVTIFSAPGPTVVAPQLTLGIAVY